MATSKPARESRVTVIAREWKAGMTTAQIAAEHGISIYRARRDLSVARGRGLIPPYEKPTPRMERAAELYGRGLTTAQIAVEMGTNLNNVQKHLAAARQRGLAPAPGNRAKGGRATWKYHVGKGSAPPLGSLGDVLEHLTAPQIEQLMDLHTKTDASLADTVARIVKEHLNGDQTTR